MTREDQFIPHLCVSNGLAALEFYKSVFGASQGDLMMTKDGKRVMHGEISIDGHKCFFSDEFSKEEGGSVKPPDRLKGTCVRITLMVDDADAVVERAVAAGAQVLMPLENLFWGARYGKILDPFGHEWGINQQLREQTSQETQGAADEYFARRK